MSRPRFSVEDETWTVHVSGAGTHDIHLGADYGDLPSLAGECVFIAAKVDAEASSRASMAAAAPKLARCLAAMLGTFNEDAVEELLDDGEERAEVIEMLDEARLALRDARDE